MEASGTDEAFGIDDDWFAGTDGGARSDDEEAMASEDVGGGNDAADGKVPVASPRSGNSGFNWVFGAIVHDKESWASAMVDDDF